MEFHLRRRQQYLSEEYFLAHRKVLENSAEFWRHTLPAHETEVAGRAYAFSVVADTTADLFLLRYTAGEPLDSLRPLLTEVIEAYELAATHVRASEKDDDASPLNFAYIEEYERLMQLIGLCFLFRRIDLLPRIAAIFDGDIAGEDTLYEDFLSYEMDDRYDVDELLHLKPYRHLVHSMHRDSDEESVLDIQKYIKSWYIALKESRWHDGHLNLTERGPGYVGYWAFEAAAVVFLLEVDDSSFRDNPVYPNELVEYARLLDDSSPLEEPATDMTRLRVVGGDVCPLTGFWTTPAEQDSRRLFTAGQVMPVFEKSAYGATIWQWSDEQ